VTTDILIREDTGTFAAVRPVDPSASQTPIFDAMVEMPGADNEWRQQAELSRARFVGMGIGDLEPAKVEWAELPVVVEPRRGWTPPRRPSDVMAEAYQERADAAEAYMRADSSDDLPGRDAGGWTPTRPVLVVDIPAPDLLQTGPQARFARWFDGQLQRAERWWRGKQAERDKRLGVGDE
jgi:hypothetical protein